MFTTLIFSGLYIFVAVWFMAALLSSAVNCIRARKYGHDLIVTAINKATKRQLLDICKGNARLKGYSSASKQGKDALRLFILARV